MRQRKRRVVCCIDCSFACRLLALYIQLPRSTLECRPTHKLLSANERATGKETTLPNVQSNLQIDAVQICSRWITSNLTKNGLFLLFSGLFRSITERRCNQQPFRFISLCFVSIFVHVPFLRHQNIYIS